MSNIVAMKRAPKTARSQMDTMILNENAISEWKLPPFQRPLRVNDKLRMIAEQLRDDGGVIPGVITLGVIEKGKPHAGTYLLDGQHRIEAFRISALLEGIADIRICHYDDMASMGAAFVDLNSTIVNMRPDDVLRGLEGSLEVMKFIRRNCDFVGYDFIRRGTTSPILSMSMVLRCWSASATETPAHRGTSAMHLANDMTHESAQKLVDFLGLAEQAWGRDEEYSRLWLALNLTMVMWLWRTLVLKTERGTKRYIVLRPEQFKQCMMSISASSNYIDWLQGRRLSERDRTPCYTRLKAIFAKRLNKDTGTKILMPMPAWDAG